MQHLNQGLLSIALGLLIVTPMVFVVAWDNLKAGRSAKTVIWKSLATAAALAILVPDYFRVLAHFTDPTWPLWPIALLSASMVLFGIMAVPAAFFIRRKCASQEIST